MMWTLEYVAYMLFWGIVCSLFGTGVVVVLKLLYAGGYPAVGIAAVLALTLMLNVLYIYLRERGIGS